MTNAILLERLLDHLLRLRRLLETMLHRSWAIFLETIYEIMLETLLEHLLRLRRVQINKILH